MLVEAAWAAARAPGPLRAFFLRISARRGQHVAAVATARKLAVIVWHLLRRQEDYAWVRPALHTKKIRDLELRAGHPARRGQRGAACVQPDHCPPEGAASQRTGPEGIRASGPRLEPSQSQGAHGRCKGGPPLRLRGGALTSSLLFATQSPMRRSTIAPTDQEKACRSHLWCAASRPGSCGARSR